jgi:hypothetical protein
MKTTNVKVYKKYININLLKKKYYLLFTEIIDNYNYILIIQYISYIYIYIYIYFLQLINVL